MRGFPPRPTTSNGIVGGRAADRHPAKFGEFLKAGFAAEATVAAVLDSAERHLRLIVNGGAIDVADSGFEALGHSEGFVYVAAEDGARQTVRRVIGDANGVLGVLCNDQRHNRAE